MTEPIPLPITKEMIELRITQITEERDILIRSAERQIAQWNGAIQMLEELLMKEEPVEERLVESSE